MELRKIEYRLLQLVYSLGAGIIVCQLLELSQLTSILFYGTFLTVFILWICSAWRGLDRFDLLMLLIVVLSFVHVALNGILPGAEFSFQYMKKYIMFCSTMIFFSTTVKLNMGARLFRFLEKIYLLIGVLLIVFYMTENIQMHLLNGIYSSYLVFHFTNPNMTAMFLTCMVMFSLMAMSREENVAYKVIFFILSIVETSFIVQTRSRNAIIVIFVFWVVFTYLLVWKRSKLNLKKWMMATVCIAPLLFVLVYLTLNSSSVVEQYFDFFVSEGKGLDSRVRIWTNALNYFKESPLLGAYYQISEGTGTSQMHNSHLDIMVSYGAGVLCLVCVSLYQMIEQMQKGKLSRWHSVCMLGFVCSLLLGIGEAALFSGGIGIYLFVGVFPLMSENIKES